MSVPFGICSICGADHDFLELFPSDFGLVCSSCIIHLRRRGYAKKKSFK